MIMQTINIKFLQQFCPTAVKTAKLKY